MQDWSFSEFEEAAVKALRVLDAYVEQSREGVDPVVRLTPAAEIFGETELQEWIASAAPRKTCGNAREASITAWVRCAPARAHGSIRPFCERCTGDGVSQEPRLRRMVVPDGSSPHVAMNELLPAKTPLGGIAKAAVIPV